MENTKSNVDFTHLHLHTPRGSLLDGFCRIDAMIDLAKDFGMDSIGISDHGTTYAHREFYEKCKAAGIHPVMGMEGYITPAKSWRKADFEKITYSDVRYLTKQEIEPKLNVETFINEHGEEEERITEEPAPYPNHVKLEKKMASTFKFSEPKNEEHVAFLKNIEENDPELYKTFKKSTRWYKCGIANDSRQKMFEWAPRMGHLLMIAKNNEGYKNLLKLTTIGSLEGFYGKPRFDFYDIFKYGKGLIATTSCLGGTVPQLIRSGHEDLAKKQIRFYQKCFDEFYLEIQPAPEPGEQKDLNDILIRWSKEMDIPLVATADAHMLRPEERPIHKAITSINKKKSDDDSDIDVYEHCVFYSAQEMLDLGIPPEAMENAYKIAHSCHVNLDSNDIKYPKFDVPDEYDFDTYLYHLANEGLIKKLANGNFIGDNFYDMYEHYKKRLDYELSVIAQKGISAYMLIVWDYINFAKSKDILVGPGRGSAAGSLVCYCLGITNLDPIRYGLLFERFINAERPGFPDWKLNCLFSFIPTI